MRPLFVVCVLLASACMVESVAPTLDRPSEIEDASNAAPNDASPAAPRPDGNTFGNRDGGSEPKEPSNGAAGSSEGGAEPGTRKHKPRCVEKDSQVLVIGDSYINWPSHTFPQDMAEESGQYWRMGAVGGMSMATGGFGGPVGGYIPDQFELAILTDSDVHTVLMDGGGNDVLLGWLANPDLEKCKDTGSSKLPLCTKTIDDALYAADALMQRMVATGVRDVVYFFYPHIPEGRPIGGPHPNELLALALPRVRDFCRERSDATNGALRCHFIDMVPVFEGHDPEWFNDDIHPNSRGSRAMAKEVWETMKSLCIGRRPGSLCCD